MGTKNSPKEPQEEVPTAETKAKEDPVKAKTADVKTETITADEVKKDAKDDNVTKLTGKKRPKASTEAEAEQESADEASTQEEEGDKKEQQKPKEEELDFKKKYYYLAAEMENMRKRNQRDRENFIKFGNEKILSSLLEVVDNLDRTISALEGDKDRKVKNIVHGVKMVRAQFLDVLEKSSLTTVESIGKMFDPNFHEAMAQQKAEGKDNDEIVAEYQKGYVLNGRLLRPAKVIVAKND